MDSKNNGQAEALDRFLEGKDSPFRDARARGGGRRTWTGRQAGGDQWARDDADPAVIQKRIDVYNAETAPVAEHYRGQGKYHGIAGMGTIEDIFARLRDAIDGLA